MYRLKLTRREKRKLLRAKWVVVFFLLVATALVVWLAWVRPIQRESSIDTFEECTAAGNPVQQTYPEVCLTKDGKRFVNTKQDQAHQMSLQSDEDLIPPTNPSLLVLDIKEWGVRVPLTMETFDLAYAYMENGDSEFLLFSYRRLIRLDVCKGDIGLKLTRSYLQPNPPYDLHNPTPTAQVDKAYFYASHTDKQCYDTANAEQVALVKAVAGDKSLTEATTALLTKLTATPKD